MNLAPSKHPWWTGVLLLLASAGLVPSAPAQGLKVTLLGTGSPGPRMDRFGPSILVEAGKQKLLFDCGRGATQRIEQNKVPFAEVDALFLSHLHSDHVVGIPDLWLNRLDSRADDPASSLGARGNPRNDGAPGAGLPIRYTHATRCG